MKKGNNLRDLATKVLGFALAFCMAVSFCAPLHVEAKKIKTLKLKRDNYSTTVEYVDSIATTVKKGTYRVKLKTKKGTWACAGYIRFVAPKTKTYAITVSDLRTNDNRSSCGSVAFSTPDSNNKYLDSRYDVTVNGKKDHWVRVHTQKAPSGGYARKRTGKIHLNEGEVLYLNFSFVGERPTKYVTAKVKIK